MAGYSHTTLVGNVGRDPESYTFENGSGDTQVSFSLAVTRKWNINGNKGEKTTWYKCHTNREGLSSVILEYVRKGKQVMVTGEVSARAYLDKETQKPVAALELKLDQLQLLGSRQDNDVDTDEGEDDGFNSDGDLKPSRKRNQY